MVKTLRHRARRGCRLGAALRRLDDGLAGGVAARLSDAPPDHDRRPGLRPSGRCRGGPDRRRHGRRSPWARSPACRLPGRPRAAGLVPALSPCWAGPEPSVRRAAGRRPAPVEWYPVGRSCCCVAALAAAPVLLVGALLSGASAATTRAVDDRRRALWPPFSGETRCPAISRFSDLRAARAGRHGGLELPDAVGQSLARPAASCRSRERLPRPWPNLPDALRLPRPAARRLRWLCRGRRFCPDPFGLAAAVVAAALGMAFVFEGLATAHVLTRGLSARRAILAAIYLATVVPHAAGRSSPWPCSAASIASSPLRQGPGITTINTPPTKET